MSRYMIGAELRIKELEAVLTVAREAIAGLPRDGLGMATNGEFSWSNRDQLLNQIDTTLEKGRPDAPAPETS